MQGSLRLRKFIAVSGAVSAGLVSAFAAAPAHASLLGTVAGTLTQAGCPSAPLSQPFLPWSDSSHYKLAPAGDFEGGLAGWSLYGARLSSGNESFAVGGSDDRTSLSLPSGSSAVSSTVCVSTSDPTVRLFARGGDSTSSIRVTVLYRDPLLGLTIPLPLGTVSDSAAWRPTNIMVNLGSTLALVGGSASVKLQFTAVGGDYQIDDVYVDPRSRM